MTRSALSVPSNIAEGFERRTRKEFKNFLSYAKGSSGELRAQIYVGIDIRYIDESTGKLWLREAEAISKMLSSLMRTLD
ncbi:four helix bundle protein [Vibrio astriarenae]|uniref:four helix bundle protein n=1 Tax=Vibrio astriarenae TaxID=1481923 RepID=UPI003735C0D9